MVVQDTVEVERKVVAILRVLKESPEPLAMGEMSQPVCAVPVRPNKTGIILQSGLNPVAAAVEAGIDVINRAMCGVVESGKLKSIWDLQL